MPSLAVRSPWIKSKRMLHLQLTCFVNASIQTFPPYSLFETLQMFTLDTPCPPLFLCKKGATTSSFGKYFPRKCVFSREKLFKVMLGKISYYAVFVQALPSALLLLLLWYSSAQCVHLSI